MNEQSKSAIRRRHDRAFRERYVVGFGLDIGAGADCIAGSTEAFPLMTGARPWDKADGDAQTLPGLEPESFDFVHASHVLEHMQDTLGAIRRWIEVCKSGGHLIIAVPDSVMYEHGRWPSRFSNEHFTSWTIYNPRPPRPSEISVLPFLIHLSWLVDIERLVVIRDDYDPANQDDQTMGSAECALEFVLRKR